MKKLALVTLVALFATNVSATTRIKRLADDRYLLTHQKQTALGGQGKALRLVYEKAGSLCVVLGYSWFEIKSTQSKGRTWGGGAAATMEVRFFHEAGEDDERYECSAQATEQQKEKMRRAVAKLPTPKQ